MKQVLCLITILFTINVYSQDADSSEIACALHVEGDYEIKSRLTEMGCSKGDPVMFYNHAKKAKWEIILPIRIAALSVCDMSLPISQVGAVGTGSYQSIMCTFSGKYREVKAEEDRLKGWNWSP
mgnify:FL=1